MESVRRFNIDYPKLYKSLSLTASNLKLDLNVVMPFLSMCHRENVASFPLRLCLSRKRQTIFIRSDPNQLAR